MRLVALIQVIGVVGVAAGCTNEIDVAGRTEAYTIRDCNVAGYGSFPTGEIFDGTFSDVMGVEAVDWAHDAPGIAFETNSYGPGLLECRQNGFDVGIVESIGHGTVNGTPGYSYLLNVVDNRPPTTFGSVGLDADASTDGSASLSGGELVTIPAELDIVAGDATGVTATLTLDAVSCTYVASGGVMAFSACSDGSGAGDQLAASAISLHLDGGGCATGDDDDDDDGDDDDDDDHGHAHGHHHHGRAIGHCIGRGHSSHGRGRRRGHDHHDHGCGCGGGGGGSTCTPLAVHVDLTTAIVPLGDADTYHIVIQDPGGTVIYDFTGLVLDGDVDIQFL